jgi:hypothetical protein
VKYQRQGIDMQFTSHSQISRLRVCVCVCVCACVCVHVCACVFSPIILSYV